MNFQQIPNGAEIAPIPSTHVDKRCECANNLTTLHDIWPHLPTSKSHYLRTLVNTFGRFMQRPLEEIKIESIEWEKDEFRRYLKGGFSPESVHTYMSNLSRVLKFAKSLGWKVPDPITPSEWLGFLKLGPETDNLIRFLIKRGRTPDTTEQVDLVEWIRLRMDVGYGYHSCNTAANRLARELAKLIGNSNWPARLFREKFMVPFEKLPHNIKNQIAEIIQWKTAKFMPQRPAKLRIRHVTAQGLKYWFVHLFSYAANILHMRSIDSLEALITEDIVKQYVEWALDVRKMKSATIAKPLHDIYAALHSHPRYGKIVGEWLREFVRCIPPDPAEDRLRRKEHRYLPHDVLAKIPKLIRAQRKRGRRDRSRQAAIQARDELLIEWLLTLPWRQRNIREMRIAGLAPNLMKCRIPLLTSISKPDWLVENEKNGILDDVWQFHFTGDGTKTNHDVHCVLPQRLVALLEGYLTEYRPLLVRGRDPGTLFLSNAGGPLSSHSLADLVQSITLRFAGRRVNPHMFRDVFAYMWLEKMPEEYLTLSKLLWHRNIATTIRIYGSRCNESTALCRMERFLKF